MILEHALGYAASLLMGLALGLTGGGGSILTVPILVYLFGIPALKATAYSLAIVGLVALWGAWKAYQSGDLRLKTAFIFGCPGIIGVICSRRIFVPNIPDEVLLFGLSLEKNSLLLLVFSMIMIAVSISMLRTSKDSIAKSPRLVSVPTLRKASLPVIGLITGIMAGFVGAGGGFLIVPALVRFGNLDIKRAVGTSLFIITLQSLLGIMGDLGTLKLIDSTIFLGICILALCGMSLGTSIRQRVPAPTLKKGFGVFVLIMAVAIFIHELEKGIAG